MPGLLSVCRSAISPTPGARLDHSLPAQGRWHQKALASQIYPFVLPEGCDETWDRVPRGFIELDQRGSHPHGPL
jgi:hypothetical protein